MHFRNLLTHNLRVSKFLKYRDCLRKNEVTQLLSHYLIQTNFLRMFVNSGKNFEYFRWVSTVITIINNSKRMIIIFGKLLKRFF